MEQSLRIKKTKYTKHPVEIQQQLHVLNPFYGIKPQYQRAEVPPGGDCNTVGDFTEQTSGQLDVVASADPRVGANSIKLTQTVAAGGTAVYMLMSGPLDLSWARYVGMWFKGGNADQFDIGDIYFYIFTKEGNYLYANRARAIDFFEVQKICAGTAVWNYKELDLDRFVKASGYEGDLLKEVWGIGWQSVAGDNGNTLNIDQIEFYTHATGYGPARGNIISIPLVDDVHAVPGYGIAWDHTAGRAAVSADNEPDFAGICVGNPSITRLSADSGAAATSITVVDASLFEPGKATIWDDSSTEALTILTVNKVTKTLTFTALGNAYTVAAFAKIAMEGNEKGTIRIDVLIDGVVNMLCDASNQPAAADAVSCASAGATLDIDDGGGADNSGFVIGKATESPGALEHTPILLGVTDGVRT